MAISGKEKIKWKPVSSKLPSIGPSDLNKKRLIVDFNSLRPIAQRAIRSLERRESFHPHQIKYLYFINITILNDKLFRNLNLHFIFKRGKNP